MRRPKGSHRQIRRIGRAVLKIDRNATEAAAIASRADDACCGSARGWANEEPSIWQGRPVRDRDLAWDKCFATGIVFSLSVVVGENLSRACFGTIPALGNNATVVMRGVRFTTAADIGAGVDRGWLPCCSALSSQRLGGEREDVANAPLGPDDGGRARVGLELAPQP
jgi:hypothetical protein